MKSTDTNKDERMQDRKALTQHCSCKCIWAYYPFLCVLFILV